MREKFPILLILIVYLGVGSLYAVEVPDWQAPDEPAHYNYVRQLANGRFPLMEPADYNEQYKNAAVSSQFAPEYDIRKITYEDWQPPLYYLLLTPIYTVADGSLTVLRLTSLFIGAGIILFAYAVATTLYPEKQWIALTTAVFIAFLPQHLSILASVNNDSLSELLIAAMLFAMMQWNQADLETINPKEERIHLLQFGVLLGLGLLTKLTAYLMIPIAGFVLLWRYRAHRPDILQAGIMLFAPAFLLGSLWWGRNLLVYDNLDPLARIAHDTAVVGQPRTIEWIERIGLSETVQQFFHTTFNSFWGQFGWMGVVMDSWIYQTLLLFSGIVFLGLLLQSSNLTKIELDDISDTRTANYTIQYSILFLLLVLTCGMHIYYNITFVQHQGRYLFPALIPISIGVASGLNLWVSWIYRLPRLKSVAFLIYCLPLGLGMSMVALDLYALYRFILPQLT
jgi:4-amino-4-deoxy-L-arabinose transferase-like glycosyltransferase